MGGSERNLNLPQESLEAVRVILDVQEPPQSVGVIALCFIAKQYRRARSGTANFNSLLNRHQFGMPESLFVIQQ